MNRPKESQLAFWPALALHAVVFSAKTNSRLESSDFCSLVDFDGEAKDAVFRCISTFGGLLLFSVVLHSKHRF